MANRALEAIARKSSAAHTSSVDTKSEILPHYYDGRVSAFSQSADLVRDELRRLYFKFVNGSLTAEDFGVDL